MSLRDAHGFIQRLREKPSLLPPGETIASVVQAGRQAGFHFDEDDLRAAHRQDWLLRWMALERVRAAAGGGDAQADLASDNRDDRPRANAR